MTQDDLAALKEEIKAELIKEMQQKPRLRFNRPWDEVKDSFLPRLSRFNSYHQYHILTAISIIVRHSFNISGVLMLNYNQIEIAKEIANKIIDTIDNNCTNNPTSTEAVI
jgi:hypothetical protein